MIHLNISAHHYSLDNLTQAAHTNEIKDHNQITLNIDHKTSALGGNSFRYNYMDEYLLTESDYAYSFWIRGK